MNSLKTIVNSILGLSLFTTVVTFPIAPQAQAQMSDQEFQMGRAREACTAQAQTHIPRRSVMPLGDI